MIMKKVLTLIPLFILFTASIETAQSQSFEEGVELYRAERFDEALGIFNQLNNPDEETQLFKGKTQLALGDYYGALNSLRSPSQSRNQDIGSEALYTAAIAHFRLKQYDRSLELLYGIIDSRSRSGIRFDAQRMYRQTLNYLAINERFETLQRTANSTIRFDLVNQSRNYVDANTFAALANELIRMEPDSTLKAEIADLLKEQNRVTPFTTRYPPSPQGIVYHIGVVLPVFEEQDPDFIIPRNLYQGMIMSAEEFNSRNPDKKVRLLFRNSYEHPDSTAKAVTELTLSEHADALIGPLFSEPAMRMAQLSEEFRVPMLAPLANSDSLNLDYNYTFQLNPTFEVHGKNMARFAVQELGLDTLAVFTEKGSLGEAAGNSFRREAERLGAYISYHIEEDFAGLGYDISEFTKVFTTDSALIDSLGYRKTKGIYAPFTGQAAPTLTNLLLNDLEAMRSEVVLLGSEEWANASPSAFQRRFFEIYYSESFSVNSDTTVVGFFEEDYETRFGEEADRFARIGYDTGNYLLQSLEVSGNPEYLTRALRESQPYDGAIMRIHFDGSRVNQHVYIRGLTPSAIERIEPESAEESSTDSENRFR